MALIKCPECGKEISDKAISCPNCGYPIEKYTQDIADKAKKRSELEIRIKEKEERFKCNACGHQNVINSEYCVKCGNKLVNIISGRSQIPIVNGNKVKKEESSVGMIALVLSILGFPAIIGCVMAISDIFSDKKKIKTHNCATIAIIVSLAWFIVFVLIANSGNSNNTSDSQEVVSEEQSTEYTYETIVPETETYDVEEETSTSMDEKYKEAEQAGADLANTLNELMAGEASTKEAVDHEQEKSDFISSCESLDYNDIMRNPDNYDRTPCVVSGSIDQIIEGWFGSYSIFVKDGNGNIWGCTYTYNDGESHLLEGDKITAYGNCDGTQNTRTVLGKQITLPIVSIKYYE